MRFQTITAGLSLLLGWILFVGGVWLALSGPPAVMLIGGISFISGALFITLSTTYY